jgi:hypothetical protein
MQAFLRARQFIGACGRLSVLQLDFETSKTDTRAVYDVTPFPWLQIALAGVPYLERRGPLVADDRGMPVRRRRYWDLYREVADPAGVPLTSGICMPDTVARPRRNRPVSTSQTSRSTRSTLTSTRLGSTTSCPRLRPRGGSPSSASRTVRRRGTHCENGICNRICNRIATGRNRGV